MLTISKKLLPTPIDFKQILVNGGLLIDVRTKSEFAKGHIKESINIPLDILPEKISKLQKIKKPVITVCKSGNRSSVAKSILKSAGIEAYNAGAWKSLEQKIK